MLVTGYVWVDTQYMCYFRVKKHVDDDEASLIYLIQTELGLMKSTTS